MKLETFFNNFDFLADAPNGVQKLRELILQLAVMGKLVPQDENNDEAASILLEKIKFEKEQLLKKGKLKEANFLLPIQDKEILYKLPTNWVWVRLGEVVEYNGAAKVSPSNIPQDAWLLELEDIEKDSSRIIQRLIFKERESKSTKAKFSKGDVLYGKLRPYLNKVVVADTDGFCTTEIVPLRGYLGIFPQYLMYALKRPDFLKYVNSKTYGVKMPRLGTEDGRNAPFPLPPLAEQKRIVAKVDELMALCDRLSERLQKRRSTRIIINNAAIGKLLTAREPEVFNKSWQHICNNFDLLYSTPDNIGKLRQAILQLAVQGKLVPQDANDEAIEEIIDKIEQERLALELSEKDKNKVIQEFSIIKKKLQAVNSTPIYISAFCVCDFITKGTTPASNELLNEGEIPYIKVYNIVNNKLDFFYKTIYISRDIHEGKLKRSKVIPGDVLMNIVGPPLGKVAIVPNSFNEWNINQALAIFRPLNFLDNIFFYYVLSSRSTLETVLKETKGTAGQDNLSLEQCRNLQVPLYPPSQQKRIVAKVNQLMSLCDELETKLTQSVTDSEKLMEAAVRQILAANSNKTDKHESVLLESIFAEAAKPETKTAGRRNKKTQGQDVEAVQLNLPLF